MPRCKDCVHFGICKKGFPFADGMGGGWCEDFKNKAELVEVVHGKWEGKGFAFKCSECGYHEYGQTVDCAKAWWHFCPNCGAKMDLERSENDE